MQGVGKATRGKYGHAKAIRVKKGAPCALQQKRGTRHEHYTLRQNPYNTCPTDTHAKETQGVRKHPLVEVN